MKIKVVFVIIYLLFLFLALNIYVPHMHQNIAIAEVSYFVSDDANPGAISLDPITCNIAISEDGGISIYSPLDFTQQYEINGTNGASFNMYTDNGQYILASIRYDTGSSETGQLAFIRLSDHNVQYVNIDRYPFSFDINENSNDIFMVGGLQADTGIHVYKINQGTLTIDYQTSCGNEGSNPSVILNHNKTKVYVINAFREVDFKASKDGELYPDLSTSYNNIWVFSSEDLSYLTKIKVDYEAHKLIRGEEGNIIVCHLPPEISEFASITIIDTADDEVIKKLHYDDIGFTDITYDQNMEVLYGIILVAVWMEEYNYNYEYVTYLGTLDLEYGTLNYIPVGDEKLGPSMAITPDYSRLYINSAESDKIYVVDL